MIILGWGGQRMKALVGRQLEHGHLALLPLRSENTRGGGLALKNEMCVFARHGNYLPRGPREVGC